MVPDLSISIFSAAGDLGSPGMVIMLPVIATINPAPEESLISRIVTLNPSGRPKSEGLSDKEYWVLAIHIGSLSIPRLSIFQ